MKKILRQHSITLGFALIGMAAVIGLGAVLLVQIDTKVKTIGEIKERIASYQKNKKAFTDEVAKIQGLEKRVSTLESSVVTSESVPVLLSSLETLAKNEGVTFEITSVQTPTEGDTQKLFVECSIVGSRTKVLSFLNIVQRQSFLVSMQRLFVYSEEGQVRSPVSAGVLQGGTQKVSSGLLERQWHAVATLQIISF